MTKLKLELIINLDYIYRLGFFFFFVKFEFVQTN